MMPAAASIVPARLTDPVGVYVVTVEFTSREIQNSWQGIERPDVRRKIGLYANQYERQRVSGAVH